MKQLSLLILLLFTFRAGAEGINLVSSQKERRSYLAFSAEGAKFTLPEGAISGFGAKLGFEHFFTDSIAVDTYFSTAFGSDGGISTSFTGFGGYLNYLVLGHCCNSERQVSVAGVPTVTEKIAVDNFLQIGVGFDQFFLNGSQSVYPTSGIGVGLSYDFAAFGTRLRIAGRTSFMSANKVKVQSNFVSFGVVFPL